MNGTQNMKTKQTVKHGAVLALAAAALVVVPRQAVAGNWTALSVSDLVAAATLEISDCTFGGNEALGAPGGDANKCWSLGKSGAVDTDGNTTILRSVFKGNRAIGGALGPTANYPVRIDATFSDANWISKGGIPGANNRVRAAVVDGSGNLYIGGDFTAVGDTVVNYIAKWEGSYWTQLGRMSDTVLALASSGSDLYAGGYFATAGGKASAYIARANLSAAVSGGRFGSLVYSPLTGFRSTFYDATIGQPYRIQTSPTLAAGSWTDFTNFTYTGPVVFTEGSPATKTNRYFRAVAP
jgi:hypothetical protein